MRERGGSQFRSGRTFFSLAAPKKLRATTEKRIPHRPAGPTHTHMEVSGDDCFALKVLLSKQQLHDSFCEFVDVKADLPEGFYVYKPVECSICLESIKPSSGHCGVRLSCQHHAFHLDCILQSMKHDRRCPVCRDDGVFCKGRHWQRKRAFNYKIQTLYANGVSTSMWADTGDVVEVPVDVEPTLSIETMIEATLSTMQE